ncbi:MAG: hypothetical protein KBG28_07395 [Kofleriaceae bacterium]|nr:hypothetical protein [Kofleriaceae bacterium]MBP6839595.1 hypothetical protein [Kofleriaceae bacterium]MBP9203769.1 hypothetical protein [Kofleriaceae bacterium]
MSAVAASILVVHRDRKTQRVVQRILGATGLRLDVTDDHEQAMRLVAQTTPRLLVLDGADLLQPHGRALVAAAELRGATSCLTLMAADANAEVPRLLATGAVSNLLVHAMPVLAEELIVTAHKLLRSDIFGLEKYLLWGSEVVARRLTRSQARSALVHELSDHLHAAGQSARVASMAMLVADELLSNAVHNAPVDAAGVAYRRDTPRDQDFALTEREAVALRWGCDARYVAIEVRDRFGSLRRDTVLAALAHVRIRETGEGAGMGLALAYRSCDHLVFDLAPGVATECIALIDVRALPNQRPSASSYNVFEATTGPHE